MFAHLLTKEFLESEYLLKKKTKKQIAEEIGTSWTTVHRYCVAYGVLTNPRRYYVSQDLSNRRFGRLVAIKPDGFDKHQKARWLCECDCGKTKTVNASTLLRGLTESCGCLKREMHRCVCFGEISGSYWTKVRHRAKYSKLEFSITIQEAWNKFLEQDKKCALTGVPIQLVVATKDSLLQTASLDRIESNQGYVSGNIQWVHKIVNIMKWKLREEEFINWCRLVVQNAQTKEECN